MAVTEDGPWPYLAIALEESRLTTATLAVARDDEPTVIHLGHLGPVLRRGLLILGEVVVVPGALLFAFVLAGHPMLGLVAVFGWRAACIGARLKADARVPATCWLAFALFVTRTVAGLVVSSVGLYLLVPVILCAAQGLFFLGSPAARRPAMMRLAADYVGHLPDHAALRRLFAHLSGIWGGVHLLSAALGAWALTLETTRAVAVTSGLGLACTTISAGGCVGWGLWRGARLPGLRIALGVAHPAPVAVPAEALAPAA